MYGSCQPATCMAFHAENWRFIENWTFIYIFSIHERFALIAGYCVVASFYLVSYSWPGLGHLSIVTADTSTSVGPLDSAFSTIASGLANSTVSNGTGDGCNNQTISGGCDPNHYSWCYSTPKATLAQYLVAYFLLSFGYPTCNIVLSTLYSKVLGPRRQVQVCKTGNSL